MRNDFRFGSSGSRRHRLAIRLQRWLELARKIGARRLLIDGSFEVEQMLLTRHPEELFGAEDETDWEKWVEFFSRTREADGRRKGLVEIQL